MKSQYKIGLGPKILFRARIIFSVLVIVILLFFTTTVIAGVSTGELQKKIIEPVKNFGQGFKEFLVGVSKSEERQIVNPRLTATSSATIKVEVNNSLPKVKTNNGGNSSVKYQYPTYPPIPTYSGKSAEQLQQESDAWWQKVQEENRQKSLDSQRQLEEFKAQSQKDMEQFRLEGQQGLEEFRAKYGLTN